MAEASLSDWAYVGGLIDGEGSITLVAVGSRKRSPRVSIATTSFELVQYLLDTFGGHYVYRPRRRANYRDGYSWRLNGRRALQFLEEVLPFLRESRKRERARLLLFERESTDEAEFVERFHAT